MENKRLKGLAKKLEDLVPNKISTVNDVYSSIKDIMRNQREYFEIFVPSDIVKLCYYIFCIKTNRDLSIGDSMISNSFVANVFVSTGFNEESDCKQCDGSGKNDCDDCYGSGNVDCRRCDGHGVETCPDCNGTGYENDEDGDQVQCSTCNGDEVIECGRCDGNKKEECGYCGGDGEYPCTTCKGEGYVETERIVITSYLICGWISTIRDRCELTENTMEPAFADEDSLTELNKGYMILMYDQPSEYLNDNLGMGECYCNYFNPNLEQTNLVFNRIFGVECPESNMKSFTYKS